MPKEIKRDYSYEDYLEIKKENKRKLDEIFAIDNYQEVLGRKYYGDNWRASLWGNHPARDERHKENTRNAFLRAKGHDIPYKKTMRDKKITQMDLDGKIIKSFQNVKEAVEEYGWTKTSENQIIKCIKGEHHTAYGFKWQLDE